METSRPQSTSFPVWPLYLLFFLSGLAALVYQVMWARSFGLVFGSTTRAASAVLAGFFFGMAVGNWLGVRLSRSRASALVLYASAEFVIAGGALGVIFGIDLFRAFYPNLYGSLGAGSALTALQVLLALVLMALPCAAMGATLPLVARALVVAEAHLGRRTASAYALNTVGATVGVLLAGFALPGWIGTRSTVALAALLSVGVGVGALGLWRRSRSATEAAAQAALSAAARPEEPRRPVGGAVFFVAAASGFATLALEVLYIRLLVNRTDSSIYSFALIVATFLVALAFGSWLVSRFVDRLRSPWELVAWPSFFAAIVILLSPQTYFAIPEVLPDQETLGYLGWLLGFALALVAPAAVLAGMVLPTAWKIAAQEVGEVGRWVGRLTAANTLAGVAGSLAAGFLIIPMAGVNLGLASIAALYAAIAAVAWAQGKRGLRRWGRIVVVASTLALLFSTVDWGARPLLLRGGETVIHYSEGEAGAVAVTRFTKGVRRLRVNNRYTLGSSAGRSVRLQRSMARFPLDLFGEPRSVAFIGLGTGITAGAVKEFPTVERVVAMELVPGVIEAAQRFELENRGILEDPRVELVVADARNHLFGSRERFDVIVGDLFAPWHAGTGYLYTTEHFRIVAERLAEGGVFAQWLQADQVSRDELRIITATFLDVFPDAVLWVNTAYQPGPVVIGLVGRRGGGDGPRRESGPAPAVQEFACDPQSLRGWAETSPRNTDDHPIIEFLAAASHARASIEARMEERGELLSLLRELCVGRSS